MGRVQDNRWLDEALNGAIHSDDTQPDFAKWKANHPEAVEMLTSRTQGDAVQPPTIRRIQMNGIVVKLAAAAVIAIAGIFGLTQLMQRGAGQPSAVAQTLTGPMTQTFDDGSAVTLAPNASIRTYADAGKRGFEHLSGQIDVTVTKGKGEFIVTTPYGDVKALGTEFTLDVVDGTTADTQERIELLAVEVTEGSVQVSNDKGASVLKEQQKLVVEKDRAPYRMSEDADVPARLRERMDAMIAAMEAGDAAAYTSNYNISYLYKLITGQVEYDTSLFGGTAEDAQRLQEALGDIASVEALAEVFQQSVNLKGATKVYLRDIEVSGDGKHATARLVTGEVNGRLRGSSPQWHYFDDDWWQVDD
jgi:ferric-dicitrate binding protein FerR (iron transport regulator)